VIDGHEYRLGNVFDEARSTAANFAKLLGLLRGTVQAAGQRLFAFHFPEHTRSHFHILRMFAQFGSAGIDRLYSGAGGGLDCGNRESLRRYHGDA